MASVKAQELLKGQTNNNGNSSTNSGTLNRRSDLPSLGQFLSNQSTTQAQIALSQRKTTDLVPLEVDQENGGTDGDEERSKVSMEQLDG